MHEAEVRAGQAFQQEVRMRAVLPRSEELRQRHAERAQPRRPARRRGEGRVASGSSDPHHGAPPARERDVEHEVREPEREARDAGDRFAEVRASEARRVVRRRVAHPERARAKNAEPLASSST
jgi:hypothetical protein